MTLIHKITFFFILFVCPPFMGYAYSQPVSANQYYKYGKELLEDSSDYIFALYCFNKAIALHESGLAQSDTIYNLNDKYANSYVYKGIIYQYMPDQPFFIGKIRDSIYNTFSEATIYASLEQKLLELIDSSYDKKRHQYLMNALRQYHEAIKIDPQLPEAYLRRGDTYFALGYVDKGYADYDHALSMNTEKCKQHSLIVLNDGSKIFFNIKEGRDDLNNYTYKAAKLYFDRALYLDKSNVMAHVRMGDALFELNETEDAFKSYTTAIRLDPKNSEAYMQRGQAYYVIKDDANAISDLTKATNLDPDLAMAYLLKGNVYYSQKRDEQALQQYTAAINAKHNFSGAYMNRARIYYERSDYSKAVGDIENVVKYEPSNAEAFYYLGLINYFGYKDNMAALDYFTKAIKYAPTYAYAYFYRGMIAYELKIDVNGITRLNDDGLPEYFDPIIDWSMAIKYKPDFVEAYYRRGIANYLRMYNNAAIYDFSKIIELQPDDPEGYYSRGITYYQKYEDSLAVEDLTIAIRLKPDYRDAYFTRGLAQIELGQYNKALDDFNSTINLDPKYPDAYYKRGLVKEILKDKSYCNDMKKAADLGFAKAEDYYIAHCAKDE